jgi:hypothetical protein
VVHRELVLPELTTTTSAFQITQTFAINPGLTASFPWLATQATSWEQYRIKKFGVEFIPNVSTATNGRIYIVPDYDPDDDAPLTEVALGQYYNTVANSVYRPTRVMIDTQPIRATGPRKFIRGDNTYVNGLKFYDSFNIYIALVGVLPPGGSSPFSPLNLGSIAFIYEIDMEVPQMPRPQGLSWPRGLAIAVFPTGSQLALVQSSPGGTKSSELGLAGFDINTLGATLLNGDIVIPYNIPVRISFVIRSSYNPNNVSLAWPVGNTQLVYGVDTQYVVTRDGVQYGFCQDSIPSGTNLRMNPSSPPPGDGATDTVACVTSSAETIAPGYTTAPGSSTSTISVTWSVISRLSVSLSGGPYNISIDSNNSYVMVEAIATGV